MSSLSFHLDTNILIPLEPTSPDLHVNTQACSDLLRKIHGSASRAFYHAATLVDVKRDKHPARLNARLQLLEKYEQLPFPPVVSSSSNQKLGTPELSLPRLLQDMSIAKADGNYPKLLTNLAGTDPPNLSDWGMSLLTNEERRDLLEILDDRNSSRSILITSQVLPKMAQTHRRSHLCRCHS